MKLQTKVMGLALVGAAGVLVSCDGEAEGVARSLNDQYENARDSVDLAELNAKVLAKQEEILAEAKKVMAGASESEAAIQIQKYGEELKALKGQLVTRTNEVRAEHGGKLPELKSELERKKTEVMSKVTNYLKQMNTTEKASAEFEKLVTQALTGE